MAITGDTNVIYAKGDNYIWLHVDSDHNTVIQGGTGSTLFDEGPANTTLPCTTVTFDYALAPAAGCVNTSMAETGASNGTRQGCDGGGYVSNRIRMRRGSSLCTAGGAELIVERAE